VKRDQWIAANIWGSPLTLIERQAERRTVGSQHQGWRIGAGALGGVTIGDGWQTIPHAVRPSVVTTSPNHIDLVRWNVVSQVVAAILGHPEPSIVWTPGHANSVPDPTGHRFEDAAFRIEA
jgi:hypothetical protein